MERRRRSHPTGLAKVFIYGARTRAKRDGLAINVTVADILAVWPRDHKCPALGTPFYYGPRRRKQRPDVPSLDRIDSRRGYVKGNLAVISWRANDLKRNATRKELQQIANWMKTVA